MPRRGLRRAVVVEAAATLADAEGLEQLTLARVAEHLGVRLPSLYNHVAGLEGLRRELALLGLRLLATRLSRATIGKSGDQAVRSFAEAYRAFAHERPGLYGGTLRGVGQEDPEVQQAGAELVDMALAVLGAYGLAGDDALHALRGLRAILHGFVSLEVAGGFGLPLDIDESFRRLVDTFIRGLPSIA